VSNLLQMMLPHQTTSTTALSFHGSRGSSSDLFVTIRNDSSYMSALDVTLSADSPTVLFSLDNAVFSRSITIPNIAPGASSPNVYMRQIIPTDAPDSETVHMTITAAEWR
jgi:hypothetical protein